MESTYPDLLPQLPAEALLANYEQWLAFVLTSRRAIRKYDRQLANVRAHYPDLGAVVRLVQVRMHQRAQFLGDLAIHLTARVAALRHDLANGALVARLNHAHPVMRALIMNVKETFEETEMAYRILTTVKTVTGPTPTEPAYYTNPKRDEQHKPDQRR